MLKKSFIYIIAMIFLLANLTACAKTAEPDASTEESAGAVNQEVLSVTQEFTDRDLSDSWDEADAVLIECAGASATILGEGAIASESGITINAEGTYVLSGELLGSVTVQAADTEKVQLVLKSVSITCLKGPAICILEADKVFITLAEGTKNTLSDGAAYSLSDADIDACLYSKTDLAINGTGDLTIQGNLNHGIHSKDDLVVASASLTVTAVNDGLKGKDAVLLKGVHLTVTAGGDGIQSNNDTDSEKGVVLIDGGEYTITAGQDGIQAETVLEIREGSFSLTTGGGAGSVTADPGAMPGQMGQTTDSTDTFESMKGLKAGSFINISGGTFTINSRDDAVHTNGNMAVSGGAFTITSGDDGLHADSALFISGGTLSIEKSYEGIEALTITLSGGETHVTASDDGLNAAGGADSSSLGRPGENSFSASADCSIQIFGGALYINATGDGIDSNGSLYVSGGTTLVSGPTNSGNGALDYASTASITGGVFIAAGSTGMAQNFGSSSTQASLLVMFPKTQAAGSAFALYEADGELIFAFAPEKTYACAVVSAPELTSSADYEIYTGGSLTDEDGYTKTGDSGGSSAFSFTLSDLLVTVSASGVSGSTGTPGGAMPNGGGTMPGGDKGTRPTS